MLRHRPRPSPSDRHEESGNGRWRGTQLRGQRPAAPRRSVRDIWIQPAAGDAGGALGAALFVWHQLLENPRDLQAGQPEGQPARTGVFERQTSSLSDEPRRGVHRFADEEELLDDVAQALADEKVVGWFHGPDGIRTKGLGARSILGDRVARDAGDHESEDQVSRELSTLRAVRASRTCARVVRHAARGGIAVHAARCACAG